LSEIGRVAAEFRARLHRHDVHDAGRGVLAVQRALRAREHLDTVDVVEVGEGLARGGHHHAVEHEGHARLGRDREVDRADAAQEQRLVQRGVGLADVEGRHQPPQRLGGHAAGRIQQAAGDHGHRDRHLLEALLALLGGDDDLLDLRDGIGRILRACGRCGGKRCDDGERHRARVLAVRTYVHVCSPGSVLEAWRRDVSRGPETGQSTVAR